MLALKARVARQLVAPSVSTGGDVHYCITMYAWNASVEPTASGPETCSEIYASPAVRTIGDLADALGGQRAERLECTKFSERSTSQIHLRPL